MALIMNLINMDLTKDIICICRLSCVITEQPRSGMGCALWLKTDYI